MGLGDMMGLSPVAAAKRLIAGKFGADLCLWFNKHQKGNRLMVETLTGQPYPLQAVTQQQILDAMDAIGPDGEPAGFDGFQFLQDAIDRQQRDAILALKRGIEEGQRRAEEAAKAQPVPVGEVVPAPEPEEPSLA
jgi:hypothetical protein